MQKDLSAQSDDQLVQWCRRADASQERPFAELYRRHSQLVWRVCRRFLRSNEDVADLVQETFFRAFRSMESFSGGEPEQFRAWLARIAANLSKNELRRRSRRPQAAAGDFEDAVAVHLDDPIAAIAARDRQRLLHQALAQLPHDQREVLELSELQGFSYPVIANRLGISLSAVKMRALRARVALSHLYDKLDEPTGVTLSKSEGVQA